MGRGIRRGLPSTNILNARASELTESAFVVPAFEARTGEAALRQEGIAFSESRTQVAGFGDGQTLVDFRVAPADLHRAIMLLEEVYNVG